jgi:hypothetical protein
MTNEIESMHIFLRNDNLNSCKENEMSVEIFIVCQLILNVINIIVVIMKSYNYYQLLKNCYPTLFCTKYLRVLLKLFENFGVGFYVNFTTNRVLFVGQIVE